MSVSKLYINGRFLTQKITGVQRFAIEVVKATDALLDAGAHPLMQIVILAPPGPISHLDLKRIRVEQFGRLAGHWWEQFELPFKYPTEPLLSLCNVGPVFRRRHIVIMHDAAVYRERRAYSRLYGGLHRALGRLLAASATIGTVSNFSRDELSKVLKLKPENIFVAPNGAEHIGALRADESIIRRLGLERSRYFLVVGSPAPHKNTDLAVAAAQKAQEWGGKTVLVGEPNPKIFGRLGYAAQSAVVLAGRVSDGELKALYQHAVALVFPSRYEGFGIPLLEAMLCGCPVIASDIPSSREVAGGVAEFVPVGDLERLVDAMARSLRSSAELVRTAPENIAFSWGKTAAVLLDAVAPPSP